MNSDFSQALTLMRGHLSELKSDRERLFKIRVGQKDIYQMVEYMKVRSEEERKEFDSHNLNLQSLLYGKHYFSGEVHFCKEFKTPNL